MIPMIAIAALVAVVAFAGGCLAGGIRAVEKLTAAENDRDEFKRRLNRILEADIGLANPDPKLASIFAFARGERV